MKVAVFDFCDTLVNFQTADAYVRYVVDREKLVIPKRIGKIIDSCYGSKIIRKIDRITKNKFSVNKRIILYKLHGLSQEVLEKRAYEFYQNCIRPNLNIKVLQLMQKYQLEGYYIYIISGGYDIYLQYFEAEYCVNQLFSTILRFKRAVFCGSFKGKDCLNTVKVDLLEKDLKEKGIISEYIEAYSDSKSDLPILLYADRGIVVSKHSSRKWIKEYGLEEILLEEDD